MKRRILCVLLLLLNASYFVSASAVSLPTEQSGQVLTTKEYAPLRWTETFADQKDPLLMHSLAAYEIGIAQNHDTQILFDKITLTKGTHINVNGTLSPLSARFYIELQYLQGTGYQTVWSAYNYRGTETARLYIANSGVYRLRFSGWYSATPITGILQADVVSPEGADTLNLF